MSAISHDPLVSVIIPVYDGAEYVGIALESAMSQTYRNLEILVIDDGSTDGTPAILDLYAARDARIRVLSQANSGVARARNRGIAEAHGDFIAPLDADDLWEPTKIDCQVRRILKSGERTGFVYSWWVWIDRDGALLDRSPRWMMEGSAFELLLQMNFTGNASVRYFVDAASKRRADTTRTLPRRMPEDVKIGSWPCEWRSVTMSPLFQRSCSATAGIAAA